MWNSWPPKGRAKNQHFCLVECLNSILPFILKLTECFAISCFTPKTTLEGSRPPSRLCHFLAVWSWESCIAFLCLFPPMYQGLNELPDGQLNSAWTIGSVQWTPCTHIPITIAAVASWGLARFCSQRKLGFLSWKFSSLIVRIFPEHCRSVLSITAWLSISFLAPSAPPKLCWLFPL